ncbi:MAG TPA: hypothetical protein VFE16_08670 [Candidatus Cybelea sp.]|jgi:hypothetical protein|nr:hypothetical protein [Candidatus Cybelea sp.]
MKTAVLAAAAALATAVLPRSAVLDLGTVQKYFPQVTREEYSGTNRTSSGDPTATRIVIFVNGDASKKVTISVDRYATGRDALAAYHQAVEKSKIPGFAPIGVPVVGQAAFAGKVTRGAETHLGIGAVNGKLVIGATLAGYAPTDANLHKLSSLLRTESTVAPTLSS